MGLGERAGGRGKALKCPLHWDLKLASVIESVCLDGQSHYTWLAINIPQGADAPVY